jgi:hypothetical protein
LKVTFGWVSLVDEETLNFNEIKDDGDARGNVDATDSYLIAWLLYYIFVKKPLDTIISVRVVYLWI